MKSLDKLASTCWEIFRVCVHKLLALDRSSSANNQQQAATASQQDLTRLYSSMSSDKPITRRRPRTPEGCGVRFGAVTVFEFERTIGDNPAVEEGCPVALAPRHHTRTDTTVDRHKPLVVADPEPPRGSRRPACPRLSAADRDTLLMIAGHALDAIDAAAEAAQAVRVQRQESMDDACAVRLGKGGATRGLQRGRTLVRQFLRRIA